MSTLKTNNIEHLDASSPSIQLDVGGGMVVAGVITATSMDLSGSDGFTVGTGASVSSPATNVLALGTNDTERLRIFSDGRIGINTTTVSFGRVQLTQESDTDEGGIGIVDSTISRSMRLYCTAASAVINSGNGGSGNLVLNEGSGNVGIGTDNPISGRGTSGKVLKVYGYGTNSIISVQAIEGVNDRNAILELLASGNGGSAAEIVFGNTDTTPLTNSPLVFSSYYSGSTVERARISNTGNFQIANGNLVFSTSGTGIDFSATGDGPTVDSEILDDYEEGTFTPTLSGFTNAGIFQTAQYIKIGRLVNVFINIYQSSNNMSFTNTATISNLPFTTITNFHTSINAEALTVGGAMQTINAYIQPTTPVIQIRQASDASDKRHLLVHAAYYVNA